MYLLYLTICTTLINPFGIATTECVTTTPARYASKSLCIAAGKSFVNAINSDNVKATITCEKENDR